MFNCLLSVLLAASCWVDLYRLIQVGNESSVGEEYTLVKVGKGVGVLGQRLIVATKNVLPRRFKRGLELELMTVLLLQRSVEFSEQFHASG
jgi:hypothetical protein